MKTHVQMWWKKPKIENQTVIFIIIYKLHLLSIKYLKLPFNKIVDYRIRQIVVLLW